MVSSPKFWRILLSSVAILPFLGCKVASQTYEITPPDLVNKTGSNIIITMREPLDPVYQRIGVMNFTSRAARCRAITGGLKEATGSWQQPILAELGAFNASFTSMWLTNQIYVRNVVPALFDLLRNFTSILGIAEEMVIPVPPDASGGPRPGAAPDGTEWSVRQIGAEEVWNAGARGQGIVVGVIDTGVRGTHEALRNNYVGAERNGWFDPINGSEEPEDDGGHGTHCTGTICGDNGIGVAPDANWMACKGCTGNAGCPQAALIQCGQFMLCPHDPQGNNEDCNMAPHIISNSWGAMFGNNRGREWYNEVIRAWDEAGIIAFFCNGNHGPGCGTQWTPGDQPRVISVGATDNNDRVTDFSSRGPNPQNTENGRTSPLIVAPGANINSAYNTADDAYTTMDGCSMATPNTAGAAALLMSQDSEIDRARMEDLMFFSARKDLPATNSRCGTNAENQYPNDIAGHGRLSVIGAYRRLTGS